MVVHEINYDEVLETALLGVRRAYIFMGLGLNAAHDPEANDYSLKNHSGIVLVPDDLPPETVEGFKKEFANWIISNGLREMVEAFTLSLDRLHKVLGLAKVSKGVITPQAAQSVQNRFDRWGLSKKIRWLKEQHRIDCQIADLLHGLSSARNCLSHRRGIVGAEDCTDAGKLRLEWTSGLEFKIRQPDGQQFSLPIPVKSPVVIEEGGQVFVHRASHACEFILGEEIRLTPNHLCEIMMAVIYEARRLSEMGAQALRDMGIEVTERPASGQRNRS